MYILVRKVQRLDKQKIGTSALRYRRLFEAAQDGNGSTSAEILKAADIVPYQAKREERDQVDLSSQRFYHRMFRFEFRIASLF